MVRERLHRGWSAGVDLAMCAFLNLVHARSGDDAPSLERLEGYLDRCAGLTPEEFYGVPEGVEGPGADGEGGWMSWASPIGTGYEENDRVRVRVHLVGDDWARPTVFMLHALMSASDIGYRRWARTFNRAGWNAVFVHLPFHYSRTPRGRVNGELAIGADVIRTAEALRQGVVELRQLAAYFRERGCRRFGLWSVSYGAWVAGLLAGVEAGLEFVVMMTPIVDVSHAIWESGASVTLRRRLRARGIGPEMLERHYHLSCPMRQRPRCGADRVLLVAGSHDRVAHADHVMRLHSIWGGSRYLEYPQGHFGYRLMRESYRELERAGWLGAGGEPIADSR